MSCTWMLLATLQLSVDSIATTAVFIYLCCHRCNQHFLGGVHFLFDDLFSRPQYTGKNCKN